MSTKRKLEEHIIEEIEKTGYPLEIEISSILDENVWFVSNQDYYFDEQQNDNRTIDMVAWCMKSFVKGGMYAYEPIRLGEDMVIECKKSSTDAWIFFTIPEEYRVPFFDGQTFEFLDVFADRNYSVLEELLPYPRDMRTERFLHYDKFQRIAITSHEIRIGKKRSKQKSRREIFEARNQIIKCISYHFNSLREHVKTHPSSRLIRFYFPVIVFDGRMYECMIEKKRPKLIERNHILLRTHYRPRYHKFPLSYGIDVVKREYFRTFIKDIEADIKLLEEQLVAKKDKILKSIDKVLSADIRERISVKK